MKQTNRILFTLLLALALTAAAFGVTALAAKPDDIIADGYCGGTGDGTNLTWSLTGDGVMTVAGEGTTGDYTPESAAPYAAYRDDITVVTFTEGVSRVGDYALAGLERLETISFPTTLESVGEMLLDGCVSLREIRYSGTYAELCAVSQPEELGDLGSVELFTIIRYSPAEWDSLEWTVEDGVLTFSGDGVIPDTALYGNTPWFDLRGEITDVIVPEGFTYIGAYAFAGLENMRALHLPATLEGTGIGTLVYCRNLEDICYNGTIEQFSALLENGTVNDFGLPETVMDRLEEIFRVNYAFLDVDWYIEDAVLHISCNGALPSVTNYKSTPWYGLRDSFHTVVVEEGVTGIGDYALAWLRRVQEVYLPASLSEIGKNVFYGDDMLYAVYCAFDDEQAERLNPYDHIGVIYTEEDPIEHFYPDQIICLGENVHRFVFEDFSFIGGSERTLLTGYTGDGPDCVLPAAPVDENGETITAYEIAPWAMKDGKWISHVKSYDDSQGYEKGTQSSSVTSLVVPDCVTVIRPQAFLDVRYLQSVTLPDGLETVGDLAFARTILKSVRLPDSVAHLGDYIFYGSDLSEGVRLPAGIEIIPKGIFMRSSLSSFTIPDTVKTIGFAAFNNCRKLTELHLNDGLEVLDDYAFEAVGLTSMIFPDSVTRIGAYCFQFCSNIEEIVWPRNLERMEVSCFRYCKKLTALILPENVKYIEGLAFDHCESVTEVSLPEGVVFVAGFHPDIYTGEILHYPIQSVFRCCASLKEIVLPASVTDIGAGMFNVCPLLERVSILGDVEYIGPYTFKDCPSLKELLLPASVRHFGLSQFDADRGGINRYDRVFYGVDESNGGYVEFDMPFTGDIYFTGTPEQWAQVHAPKDDLSGAAIHFRETRSKAATCTEAGFTDAVMFTDSDYVIIPGETIPATGHHPENVAATEATATEHGYTEGVYCPDCDTWLSGHEVIHNTLGDREILREPTATEAGECIITCTVCGEQGLYAMEPVNPAEPPTEPDGGTAQTDNSAIGRIRKAMKSIIEFFLRLLRWFGENKKN